MERDFARLENIIEDSKRHHDIIPESQKQEIDSIVAQLLDGATIRGDAINEIDWDVFITICDLINERPQFFCKAFGKGIRAHMKKHSKEPRIIWLTLNLLETCVKNCGQAFFFEISTKEFIDPLRKIADRVRKSKGGKKVKSLSARDLYSDRIEEKILRLIQSFGPLNPIHPQNIYTEYFEKMRKKGIIFPVPSFEDKTVFTQPQTRSSAPKSRSVPAHSKDIPADIRQKLEEIKSVVTLVEQIATASPGENLNNNEIAAELKPNIMGQRDALTALIQKYSDGANESFLSICFLLFERVENVLGMYDGKVHHIEPSTSSEAYARSSDEEDFLTGKPSSRSASRSNSASSSSNPFSTTPVNTNPFLDYNHPPSSTAQQQKQAQPANSNNQQEDFFRSPAELGLDLLAKMKTKPTTAQNNNNDPLLDWLLKGF